MLVRYWTVRTSIPGFIDPVYFDEFLGMDDLLTYWVHSLWYLFPWLWTWTFCFFTTTSLTCSTYSLMLSHYIHCNMSSFVHICVLLLSCIYMHLCVYIYDYYCFWSSLCIHTSQKHSPLSSRCIEIDLNCSCPCSKLLLVTCLCYVYLFIRVVHICIGYTFVLGALLACNSMLPPLCHFYFDTV